MHMCIKAVFWFASAGFCSYYMYCFLGLEVLFEHYIRDSDSKCVVGRENYSAEQNDNFNINTLIVQDCCYINKEHNTLDATSNMQSKMFSFTNLEQIKV